MASESRARKALEEHEKKLITLPNVVGLGIVPLDRREPRSRDLAVAVYVRQKVPESELAEGELIPPYLELSGRGRRVDRVPTRVIETGEIEFEKERSVEKGFGTEAG